MDDGSAYGRLLADLKQALDPQGILSPGRYVQQEAKPAAIVV
jgi:hypothetical protein